jgi:hypothetical protein
MHRDKGIDVAIETARRTGVPLKIAAKMREPHEQQCYTEVVRPLLGREIEYVGEVNHGEKIEFLATRHLSNGVPTAVLADTVRASPLAAVSIPCRPTPIWAMGPIHGGDCLLLLCDGEPVTFRTCVGVIVRSGAGVAITAQPSVTSQ